MFKRAATLGIAVFLGLAIPGPASSPGQAIPVDCDPENMTCPGGGGGGTTPPPVVYNLQGVIQNEGYESYQTGRRVKIRGHSRLANASNDRVDADYINVRCYAYDALGGYTADYDSENGGASST